MPKAVRIEEENVESLIEWGKSVEMNLSYLRDYVNPEFPRLGPNYLVTDGSLETNNVTCTIFCGADLLRIWKFVDGSSSPYRFSEIKSI